MIEGKKLIARELECHSVCSTGPFGVLKIRALTRVPRGVTNAATARELPKRVDPGFPKHPSIGIVRRRRALRAGLSAQLLGLGRRPLSFWRVMLIARVPPGSGKAGSGRGRSLLSDGRQAREDEHERVSGSWGWGLAVIAKSPTTPGPKTRQWVEPPIGSARARRPWPRVVH